MAHMKLQKLESYLQEVEDFVNPKINLEQYMTRPHLAATALHTIESRFHDIDDKLVADLGCGTGMLTIGTAILGASFVVSVDVDDEVLTVCQQNLSEFEISNVDLIQMNVAKQLQFGDGHRWKGRFDTVIMNPPFGTKGNEGADIEFLRFALFISRKAVYSMHKSATREHMTKLANSWGLEFEVVAQMKFDLPQTYKKHRRESVDIEVDMLRFEHLPTRQKLFRCDIPAPMGVCVAAKDPRFTDKRKRGQLHKK